MPRKTKTSTAADPSARPKTPAELLNHLIPGLVTAGQAQPEGSAKHRNGTSAKTVLTDMGGLFTATHCRNQLQCRTIFNAGRKKITGQGVIFDNQYTPESHFGGLVRGHSEFANLILYSRSSFSDRRRIQVQSAPSPRMKVLYDFHGTRTTPCLWDGRPGLFSYDDPATAFSTCVFTCPKNRANPSLQRSATKYYSLLPIHGETP